MHAQKVSDGRVTSGVFGEVLEVHNMEEAMTETIVTSRKEEEPVEPAQAPGTEEEREAQDLPDDDEEPVPAARDGDNAVR